MGNIHSILKALRLYEPNVEYTSDPQKIKACKALVLPGDGAFAAAMDGLKPSRDLIQEHVRNERPLLGICIGFQVLFEDSTESDSGSGPIAGLGLLQGKIRKFSFEDKGVRVPHMGWNRLIAPQTADNHSLEYLSSYMYFIHSYRAERIAPAEAVANCDYAGDVFPAIVRHKSILACQFHPEKSSDAGLALLRDWVGGLSDV
ncbi:MAG: imidazole glycerol phosphate synthase subunit HisH [Leptospirales bacterium]|nr:imidazole glycerol phosphate synthase subunit HisH [Leptospirales bacterium]